MATPKQRMLFDQLEELVSDSWQQLKLIQSMLHAIRDGGKYGEHQWKDVAGKCRVAQRWIRNVERVAHRKARNHVRKTCRHERLEVLNDGRKRCTICYKKWAPAQPSPLLGTM